MDWFENMRCSVAKYSKSETTIMEGIGEKLQLNIIKTVMLVVVTTHTTNGGISEQCGKCHYVSWAYDANCKNLSLIEPPKECSDAKVLDLRYNNITNLLENAFAGFTDLYHVDLENNHLMYVHPNAFAENTMLCYIYLQENLLTNVTRMTFTGVPNLKELYLNKNQICVVKDQAFHGLFKLDVLHFSNNNLSMITYGILSNLKRLRYLYMANNHLHLIQNETFLDLENLRYLDLNFNKIAIIEPDAFKGLVSLHVLKLAQNNIMSIGFNALLPTHHLDLLNISGNSIATISNFTHIFQILDEFYMEDNPLECNADLKPVISWYQKRNSSGTSDDPVCDKPKCLKGHKIKQLTSLVCWFTTCEPEVTTPGLQTTEKPQKEQVNVMNTWMNIIFAVGCIVIILGIIIFIYCTIKNRDPNKNLGSISMYSIVGKHEVW